MRTVTRLLLAVPAALLLAVVVTAPAGAAQRSAVPGPPAATVLAAAPASPTSAGAPAGPNIQREQQQADTNLAHRKLAMGIASAVLLVIVFFGHRQRSKSRVRKRNLQNAKG